MIKYVSGDFFDYQADIRINTVNCVGVMGAGVALAFKNKYPKMFSDYARECKNGTVKPGKPHVWHSSPLFDENITIINFPTKIHWKNPSEYAYIEAGLKWLRNFLQGKKNRRITVPALGCGHGGLDWSKVKPMIASYLKDIEMEILVFEPSSSRTSKVSDETLKLLENKGIDRLIPGETNYPSRLKGRSATEFYLQGDARFFDKKTLSIIIDPKAEKRELNAVIQCIESISDSNVVYILGFNSSVEKDLVKELLQRRVQLILFIPLGILNHKIRKDIQSVWDETLVTVVSHTKPKQSWRRYESVKSFKLRLELSDVVLISNLKVDLLEKFEASFKDKENLFFINYGGEKKPFFDRISATGIGRNPNTMLPNTTPITSAMQLESSIS